MGGGPPPPVLPRLTQVPADMTAVDAATLALYDRVRARHAAFVARIDAGVPRPAGPAHVVVVPGAFHTRHRHTGADGQRVFDLAADLGWTAERAAVPDLGTLAANATVLLDLLARRRDRPVILVSLSKGGADVRTALATTGADLGDVCGWLNLSGLLTGTPLLAWLRGRPLRFWGARALLAIQRQPFAPLHELRDGPAAPLAGPVVLPPGVRATHVVGFPTVATLSHPWARRAHARLAPLGPSDGGGLMLAGVLDLPGDVYPVPAADHYLRPARDVRPLLRNLLCDLARG